MSKINELQYSLFNEEIQDVHSDEFLAVRKINQQLLIHCQTRYGYELESRIVEAIAEPKTANLIKHIQFNTCEGNSSDEYPLNLGELQGVSFPNLYSLIIPSQNESFRTFICDGFDETKENGTISKILNGCPQLRHLSLPCAPDKEFRNVKLEHILSIDLSSCFVEDGDKFIKMLTTIPAEHFPSLESLTYTQAISSSVEKKFLASPIGKQLIDFRVD